MDDIFKQMCRAAYSGYVPKETLDKMLNDEEMKNEEILEGNKLIAEFMGKKGIYPEQYTVGNLSYHLSWDKLMPVVEKIEQDEKIATMLYVSSWDNRGRYCFSCYRELDENGSLRNIFIEFASQSKIESVWIGVVEFIRLKNSDMIPRTEEDFSKHYQHYQHLKTRLQYGE